MIAIGLAPFLVGSIGIMAGNPALIGILALAGLLA